MHRLYIIKKNGGVTRHFFVFFLENASMVLEFCVYLQM